MQFDAFICYRRENGFLLAQLLRGLLKDRGFHCFLDLNEMHAGKFDERLLNAVHDAPNFLLLLTEHALDRCTDPSDWMRREILAALDSGKNIIPVRVPEFLWQNPLPDALPAPMHQLPRMQDVPLSKDYLPAVIEKIISYMDGTKPARSAHFPRISSGEFFQDALCGDQEITGVDLAFHCGTGWLVEHSKLNILSQLIEQQVPIRILLNRPDCIRSILSHTTHPLKRLAISDNYITDWQQLQTWHSDLIAVRAASMPLMHRSYIIHKGEDGAASVRFYTCGNFKSAPDYQQVFTSPDPNYLLFADEFSYIWDKASEPI